MAIFYETKFLSNIRMRYIMNNMNTQQPKQWSIYSIQSQFSGRGQS